MIQREVKNVLQLKSQESQETPVTVYNNHNYQKPQLKSKAHSTTYFSIY